MKNAFSIRDYGMVLCVFFGIACVVYLLAIYFLNIETEVMIGRFVNANDVFNGVTPDLEYPPFALVFMLIPRFFASTEYWYNVAYVVQVFIFFVLGLITIRKLAIMFSKDEKKMMLIYSFLMLMMFEFVVDRYDIFPMVITLISFYCFVTKRYTLAFVLLSLGTMTKLYPAVLFPVYLILLLMNRDLINSLKGTMAFIITALAVIIPVMIIDPDMISFFIEYHADRPLHVESVAASLVYPFAMFGFTDVWIEYSFGSDNLMGTWPNAVASVMVPLMIISIVLVYCLQAYVLKKAKKRVDDDDVSLSILGSTVLLTLLLFMVAGKVLSSQYLIWIIPPVTFMLMTDIDQTSKRNIFLLFLIAIVLTQTNFAYNIGFLGGGENINDLGMMILLARNIIIITMTYFLLKLYSNTLCRISVNEPK